MNDIQSSIPHVNNEFILPCNELVIPNRLKTSTTVPIRKVVNTKQSEEFRSVNMLPAFEKIFEKKVDGICKY